MIHNILKSLQVQRKNFLINERGIQIFFKQQVKCIIPKQLNVHMMKFYSNRKSQLKDLEPEKENLIKEEYFKKLNSEYQQEIEKIKYQEKIQQQQNSKEQQAAKKEKQQQELEQQQKQAKQKQQELEQKRAQKLQEIQQKQINIKNFQQNLSLNSQSKLVKKPPKRVKNKYIIFQNHMMKFLRNELKADQNSIKSSWLYQKVKQYWEGQYESDEIKQYVEKIKVLCEQEAEFQKEMYYTQMKQFQEQQKGTKRIYSPFVFFANETRQKYINNPNEFKALYEQLKQQGFQEYLWEKEVKKADFKHQKINFSEFQVKTDEKFQYQEKPNKNVMNLSSMLGFQWVKLPESEKNIYIEKRDNAEKQRQQNQKQQDFDINQNMSNSVPFKKKYSGYVVFLNEQKKQNHLQLDPKILQQVELKKQQKTLKSYTKGQIMIQYYAQIWRNMSEDQKQPYRNQAEVLNSQLLRQQKQFISHYGVDKNDIKKIKKEIQKNKINKLAIKEQKSISMKNYLTDKQLQNQTDNFYESDEEFITSEDEESYYNTQKQK